MPTSAVTTHFDEKKPVYVIKSFFYGKTNNSVRHATDQPLRLSQIPTQYQTSEFIKQGRVVNRITAMVTQKNEAGIEILPESTEVVPVNPIEPDKTGLRASTPTAKRRAVKKATAVESKAKTTASKSN